MIHLDSLPAVAGGCPSTVSHAESVSQYHLGFKDSLDILAIWTQTRTADSDRISNESAYIAASFCSAIGWVLCLDHDTTFRDLIFLPIARYCLLIL